MKLQSISFDGNKVISISSQAIINISLFNTLATPKQVTIKIVDELGNTKSIIYQAQLQANSGYEAKVFANSGQKIEIVADAGVGGNVGILNENYIAKGVLNTEYISCVGDGVKSEFSFNGISVNSFKEVRIIFDGLYEAVFAKDYSLNSDKSGVVFNQIPANGLEFIILITKQE
ncbi:hypothetical protein CVIC8964_0801 [Campylobacter vicugnae]|uniref:Uncharacterized protein n=1 Tax=Campylobacter vicugnae TaxID=1660076 RepID=A0A1X9T174_9BACT|nr:hypothetical protein [Campylobacter sp. RM8964]ARR02213.1 hypothetical protein CVIC8964_0801 [Campylobacter sp. RM8964]